MTRRTEADEQWDRAQDWAREVIAERARLDAEDPDWDLLLEQARERWIGPPAGLPPPELVAQYDAMKPIVRRHIARIGRMERDVQLR